MRNEGLVSNDAIVTLNVGYNILWTKLLYVCCVGGVFILYQLNHLKQTSSFQVASLSDEHSLLKKFSDVCRAP